MPDRVEMVDVATWKDAVADATAVHPEIEQYGVAWKGAVHDVIKAPEDEGRTRTFIISDGEVDRDNDTISPKGWDLKQYRQNPVVLFGHNSYDMPIGRSLKIWRDGDNLMARAEFCEADCNPMGEMIFRMLERRFLRAASVGFRPKQWERVQDEERPYGVDFLKQELLEWSIVPIPANPRALEQGKGSALPLGIDLMGAHAAGIDTSPLKSWCERALDMSDQLKGLTPSDVEGAWKALGGQKRFVDLGRKAEGWFAAKSMDAEDASPIEEPAPRTATKKRAEPDGEGGFRLKDVEPEEPSADAMKSLAEAIHAKALELLDQDELPETVTQRLSQLVELRAVEISQAERERYQKSAGKPGDEIHPDLAKALTPQIRRDPDGGWTVYRGAIAVAHVADPNGLEFRADDAIELSSRAGFELDYEAEPKASEPDEADEGSLDLSGIFESEGED